MATLVLGAIGTLVGGPLGGAIGATLGRGLDREIIGNGRREGPRLTELAVSTSSYGQPIPGLYGRVRVPGSVIWASDLAERRETSGGGKGRPKTTSYSYSVSLAVALSSRPIERVGRIWADGHLLRGAAGDLKTGGSLRVHRGHADQPPDPLLVAELGARCPAFRGCAYVVFEDLALEDFGNRVPALSFEVLAGSATGVAGEIARTHGFDAVTAPVAELEGYIHDGGSAAATLTHLARLTPLGVQWTPDGPQLASVDLESEAPITLSDPVVTPEGDFGRMAGIERTRATLVEPISALRYYDSARSYQPGLQRAPGEAGGGAVLELPGVLNATNARALLMRTRLRERWQSDTLSLRIAVLDPKVGPGSIVRVPDHPGLWQVTAWEWREIGIELDLQRHATATPVAAAADSGAAWDPPDRQAVGSLLRAFELPWDGTGPDGQPQRFAAIGAPDGRWAGAALYHLRDGALIPLGESGPDRAVGGRLLAPLAPSRGLRFEPTAGLTLQLDHNATTFEPATTTALAQGANRLLVGEEIIQFARCEALGEGEWRLFGLLRGRGGTEHHALVGHSAGTPATALDERLWALPGDVEFDANSRLATIGHADDEPVYATLEGSGSTRRPLSPVHPRQRYPREGGLELSWTRRARGGWHWLNEVEQPLVEQDEIYEIGIGEPVKPERIWTSDQPRFDLGSAALADVVAAHPGQPVWVRQSGSYARSLPLLLTHLPSTI